MAARRTPVLPINNTVDLIFRDIQCAHSGDLQNTAECHICNEPFLTGCDPERPVILRCGHIMGEGCILKWMSPLSRRGGQNSCPLCRKPLLDLSLRALDVPTTHRTQSGESERSVTWQQVWHQAWDQFCIDLRSAWDQFCIDVRSTWHQHGHQAWNQFCIDLRSAWHQFCIDLQRIYTAVSIIGLLSAVVLFLLICLDRMDIKPLPIDWLRKNPTGQLRFQPTPTYQ